MERGPVECENNDQFRLFRWVKSTLSKQCSNKKTAENLRGLLGLFFLPAWHLAWYECEWAAGCISLSDNRRLASAAILDKIRVCWPTLAGGMGARRRSIRHTRRTLHSEYILTVRFTLLTFCKHVSINFVFVRSIGDSTFTNIQNCKNQRPMRSPCSRYEICE